MERGSGPRGEKEEGKEGGSRAGGVGKGFRLGLSFLSFSNPFKTNFQTFF
jgi:hypothetical protein